MSVSSSSSLTRCCDCFRWFPVLFIVTVVAWSYYAFVVQLCIFSIESNVAKQVIYLIFYHVLLLLFLISYYKTIFSKHQSLPGDFKIPADDLINIGSAHNEHETRHILENLAKSLPVVTRSYNGAIRYCEICSAIKPDRAHHCSHCRTCVLKMDHHCPWVNNCVGHSNYKFFVLFLFYAFLFCLFIAATSLEFCIKMWSTGMNSIQSTSFHLMFLFIVSIAFSFSVSFLFFYHIYLTAKNRSTLESYRAPVFVTINGADKNGFNLGWRENVSQVFGDNKLLAFLPIFTTKNDGVVYETSHLTGINNELIMSRANGNGEINRPFFTNEMSNKSDFVYPLNDNNIIRNDRIAFERNGQINGGDGGNDSIVNILDNN